MIPCLETRLIVGIDICMPINNIDMGVNGRLSCSRHVQRGVARHVARVQRQDTCVLEHVGHVTGKVMNKTSKKFEGKRVQLIRSIIY